MNLTKPAAVLLLLAFALTLSGPVLGNPTNIAAGVSLSRADKCAICEATVHELIDDLIDSKNQPQLDLDLRGRLDPSGKRKGKVLPYHGSDLHMLELLEKVCDRMTDYSRSVTDDVVSLQRHNPRTSGGSVTLSNVEVDNKVSEKFKQYCAELVGGNEDEITNLVNARCGRCRQRVARLFSRGSAFSNLLFCALILLFRSGKQNLSPREFSSTCATRPTTCAPASNVLSELCACVRASHHAAAL
jgi:hypothetical protein